MTTQQQQQQTPFSDYFSSYDQPLLGGVGVGLFVDDLDGEQAWDANLHPHEYGDQSGHVKSSGSWDDHSFTDSDSDFSDAGSLCDNDDDSCCVAHQITDDSWNLVYSTSLTVVTATSPPDVNNNNQSSSGSMNGGEGDHHHPHSCGPQLAQQEVPPAMPQPVPLSSQQQQQQRRDSSSSSKVRFCEQPPQEHSYEHCSRAEHAQLYYSVHELQKFLEELRMESAKKQQQQGCSVKAASSGMVIVARPI